MRVGVAVPLGEIGHDLGAVRAFVIASEQLGYAHVRVVDHVIGADPAHHRGVVPLFHHTHLSYHHEPLTLLAYLSAITTRIELVTGVLVLPQRQTALVAKQAAEVDVLSGGRLRLGVGVGWNPIEYAVMNERFETRGRRIEEQIRFMRLLWSDTLVDFSGEWHAIKRAGLMPLPVQRSIPIWMGTGTTTSPVPPPTVLGRIARLADGWFSLCAPTDARQVLDAMSACLEEAGRDPTTLGMEARLDLPGRSPEQWVDELATWRQLGATHLSVSLSKGGLSSAGQHLDLIERFSEAAGLRCGADFEVARCRLP